MPPGLLHLGGSLARQLRVRVNFATGGRKVVRQHLGPVALLLQGLSQLLCSAFRGLLDLCRFGARVAC